MREGLHEPVSVIASYNKVTRRFKPSVLDWNGRKYRLGKIDFYHKTKSGVTTLHHFSISDLQESAYFKLLLNSSTLNWTLEEYQFAGENQAHYI